MTIIGTIHHSICPICNMQTVDPNDGYCKNAYCGEDDDGRDNSYTQRELHKADEEPVEGDYFNDSLEYPQ